jgi:hypothetical protein
MARWIPRHLDPAEVPIPAFLMQRFSAIVAGAAAVAVAAVGFVYGTYAAGGSDSSCYALMADAFASGHLQPTSALVSQVPWPDAPRTFTPGGFVASQTNSSASAPVCAPGFSLLLAPLVMAAGTDAVFMLTPIAGALLVWLTFVAARHMAGPLAGAMAAVLMAVSPPMLYQVVQPMNDVITAALWIATFVALVTRRWMVAGLCCGVALLVRPNLLPLGIVATLFVIASVSVTRVSGPAPNRRSPLTQVAGFAIAAIPFCVLVLFLNDALYGSPFRTGYGQLGHLFGVAAARVNAPRYFAWLVDTHTPFPLLSFAAPFLLPREHRPCAWLAVSLIAATCLVYFIYVPFNEWTYVRFLLPAISMMNVLACAVTVTLLQYAPAFGRVVVVMALTAGLGAFCVHVARDRQAFALKFLEQRYRSAGIVVRDRLPADAVVLAEWDSGAVRFHGRKEALTWQGLDPAWLDRSLMWLDEHGRTPYILLESWEEPGFRTHFNGSEIGKLDWPPKYEVDRSVRIYDPRDRSRYDRGERVETEYLWPLRR